MRSSTHSAERQTRRTRASRRLALALLLSIALHATVGLLLVQSGLLSFAAPSDSEASPRRQVSMRSFSADDWQRHRQRAPQPGMKAQKPRSAPPPQKPKPEPPPKGKVVATAPGNGERPEDSKFLAETNNRVEKETVSRHRRADFRNVAPKPTGPKASLSSTTPDRAHSDSVPPAGEGGDALVQSQGGERQAIEIPRQEASVERQRPTFEGLSGVPLRFEESRYAEAIDGNSHRLRLPSLGSGAGRMSRGVFGAGGLTTLTPSSAVLDRIAGAPAADISPEDGIEEGEGTYLNTREWKHASFFNRVKESVGQHWDPNALIAIQDPTGEAYLFKNRHTLVAVTLDATGSLKSVRVTRPSGVEFLDKEAMDAFHRAGPFPHPPTALQNDRGEITFSFGFYLEVNRGRLRLFR